MRVRVLCVCSKRAEECAVFPVTFEAKKTKVRNLGQADLILSCGADLCLIFVLQVRLFTWLLPLVVGVPRPSKGLTHH